ncbi:MAG: hypothetical protein QOI70_1383 [Microbacteriaceae bacterium]|nr:hypothetical protein [Microbacteriaceae bacterium]MDQ1597959.1 hypothetical protein [Microbacteriaceae bacterium]
MKIIAFVVALALFVGGILLMGYAFEPGAGEAITFFGGILCIALSLAIPFTILKRLER